VKSVQGHATFTYGDSVGSREYKMNPWTKNFEIPLTAETDIHFVIKSTENKKKTKNFRVQPLVKKKNRVKINDVAKKKLND
jgi:hypothetical protein